MSRRGFIKGGAAAVAGAAVLGAVGCGNDATTDSKGSTQQNNEFWMPDRWDYEIDVIVVGYGNAGCGAAVAAEAAGANVLVLEKAPHGGGNSACAMGNALSGWDDVSGMVDHLIAVSYNTVDDRELVTSFVESLNSLPDDLEDLTNMAIKWDIEPGGPLPLGDARYPYLPGHDACAAGGKWVTDSDDLELVQMGSLTVYRAGLATFMHIDNHLVDKGVEIKYNTAAQKLIQNPVTKEILGVVASEGVSGFFGEGGQEVYIKANKGVILACGGFENNHEMFHQYSRYSAAPLTIPPLGTPYNTGDGMIMATEVGAQLWHTATAETYNFTNVKAASDEYGCAISVALANASIFVNRQGERFMSEKFFQTHTHATFPFYDFTHTIGAPSGKDATQIQDYENVPYFLIFDEATMQDGKLNRDIMGYNLVHGLYEWSEDNQAELEKGWIVKGDTIEELAEKITCIDSFGQSAGVDAAGLKETINTYNQYCTDGEDRAFGRYADTLVALDNPPYYAIEVTPYVVNTWGGAKRNAACEVFDVRDNTIPRLYSAGEFGSIFNEGYVGACNFPEALATGLIAGKNAAGLDSWSSDSGE